MFDTLDALRESLAQPAYSPEYRAKMLHEVPQSTVIDREASILKHCTGKRVLEFGASGPLHEQIRAVAASYWGFDRVGSRTVLEYDLDAVSEDDEGALPWLTSPQPEIVVCGEVLEHLANPGWFLERLKRQYPDVPVILTVPNAFSAAGHRHIRDGVENVNKDHVAWYSHRTLRTLLERYGYAIEAFHWYKGEPFTAEGMLVVAR